MYNTMCMGICKYIDGCCRVFMLVYVCALSVCCVCVNITVVSNLKVKLNLKQTASTLPTCLTQSVFLLPGKPDPGPVGCVQP